MRLTNQTGSFEKFLGPPPLPRVWTVHIAVDQWAISSFIIMFQLKADYLNIVKNLKRVKKSLIYWVNNKVNIATEPMFTEPATHSLQTK